MGAVPPPRGVWRTGLITPDRAEALAGLLDVDVPSADELPALWHWVYLPEHPRQDELGPDGHPLRGVPAPPGPGRLRMFAGGRVATHAPLRFGQPATRTTRLVGTVDKRGRSGRLTFATVRGEWEQGGRLVIVDEQDIVYREAGSTLAPSPGPGAAGPDEPPPGGRLEMDVDPVVLFRFSALTYNAHRIHYDATYATAEGYPGLVVHGPLQALLMGECLRRSGVPVVGTTFSYRMVAPTFGAQRLAVAAAPAERGHSARVRDGAGHLTATATLLPLDPATTG